jgi:hypothetical protein
MSLFKRYNYDQDSIVGVKKLPDLSVADFQSRGGLLNCVVSGDRVFVSGSAVRYSKGYITV